MTFKVLPSTVREEKETKDIHQKIRKEEMALFIDDMMLYVENPLGIQQKILLELKIEFSKVI